MPRIQIPCIVVYDDGDRSYRPMSWDPLCSGALEPSTCDTSIAMFPSHEAARTAIQMSKAWNTVLKLQNKPRSDDFDAEFIKNIKIVPLQSTPPDK